MAYESRNYYDQDIDNIREKSMSGESGKRTKGKIVKMSLKAYKTRLKVLAASVAVVTSVAVSCVPGAVKTVSDNWTVNKMMNSFHAEYVSPETHRTDNNEHFFYDYGDIARHLEEYGDFDEAVYLLNRDIGYYQTGLVLRYTPYESFTKYLEQKGYKDEDDFRDHMKDRIIKELELLEMQDELISLSAQHTSDLDEQVRR